MDESAETSSQRPLLYEKPPRKSSLSDKLNKFTSNAFRRRHTSGTLASSEDSTNMHRRSYIPAPSFGSRTSSLFNGLSGYAAEDTDSSHSKRNGSRGPRVESRAPRSRRDSQLTCNSTSSFFGNNTSGAFYPKEFLEKTDSATWEKENANGSSSHINSLPGSQQPQGSRHQHESEFSEKFESMDTEDTNIIEPTGPRINQHGRSEDLTSLTVKASRPTRHLNTPFFKQHSARQSVGSAPPIPPFKSTASATSTHIKERRLMAPINPPLPRSSTMAAPFNTSARQTIHQTSPDTPNFMRPTSTSAARTTQLSRSFKSPPTPLNLIGGEKTDNMTGFAAARAFRRKETEADKQKKARKQAAKEAGQRRQNFQTQYGQAGENFGPPIGQPSNFIHEAGVQSAGIRADDGSGKKLIDQMQFQTSPRRGMHGTEAQEAEPNSHSTTPQTLDSNASSPSPFSYGQLLKGKYASTANLRESFSRMDLQPPVPTIPQRFTSQSCIPQPQFPESSAAASSSVQPKADETALPDNTPVQSSSNSSYSEGSVFNAYMEDEATPRQFPAREDSLEARANFPVVDLGLAAEVGSEYPARVMP
ncbi:MAG: hypothetical protein Q9218_007256, partial [Villophora microphyllina]